MNNSFIDKERKLFGLKSTEELEEVYINEFKPAYDSGNLEEAARISEHNRILNLSREERMNILRHYHKTFGVKR